MQTGWSETIFQRMREEGATSCLAGHAGNWTLTWDGVFSLPGLFRQGRWLRLISEAGALSGYHPLRTARSLLRAAIGPSILPKRRESQWRRQVCLHPRAEADLKI